MRVLVAGGAGFIGGHVDRALLAAGHEVICVDDLSTGSRATVEELGSSSRFRFIETDVRATPEVAVERIIHLASPASPVDYARRPLETMAANAFGTWRLLELAAAHGAFLTFVSTSEVYGDPQVHPQPEAYWGNVDPIGPRSCYDESKRFGEALVQAFRRSRGNRANIVRVFNTYGPGMRSGDGRLVPELIAAALDGRPLVVHGDGYQTRSFCYVDDLVVGLLAIAFDDSSDGEVFNLGNPEESRVIDVVELVRQLVRPDAALSFAPRPPGDPERRRPDITRVSRRYGWAPTVPLSEGLRRTVEWFVRERATSGPASPSSAVPRRR